MSGFSTGFRARNRVREARLAEHTTMRIGGPALLVEFNHRQDLAELLEVPRRWLGKGANLLVGDDGVSEAVIMLGHGFASLEIGPVRGGSATVRAGAGLDLAKLMSATIAAGLAGPEGLSGVPATVGGALRMNAGTSTCWMLDWVARVEVVLPGEVEPRWLERAALPASYRSCGLGDGVLFLGCEFELATDDPAKLKANATRLKQAKAASQPLAARSAGCVFKNPSPDMPAGKLIDELGLKNARIGQAVISPVHANFIVNEGQASAANVAGLIKLIRSRAWRQRGVVLQTEVETWNCPQELKIHPREYEGVEV
jgi:UDP-N-acetylenolpyruvoylglucosamine reductase